MSYWDDEVRRSQRHTRNMGIAAGIMLAVFLAVVVAIVAATIWTGVHGCH